jgi:hypothetical protein
MKPSTKAILFFIAIAIASFFITSCRAPLGCQDTGKLSGYVPNPGKVKVHMVGRRSY